MCRTQQSGRSLSPLTQCVLNALLVSLKTLPLSLGTYFRAKTPSAVGRAKQQPEGINYMNSSEAHGTIEMHERVPIYCPPEHSSDPNPVL